MKVVSGAALQWFKAYLSLYFQGVVKGEVSKSQHLATGVPQGSVLGPLLFSFTSDLTLRNKFFLITVQITYNSYLSFQPDDPMVAVRISAGLTDISCWMNNHHLQLNLTKTELLMVSAN